MEIYIVLFAICLGGVFGQTPVNSILVNARRIFPTPSNAQFASDTTIRNRQSIESRLASDGSVPEPQSVNFRPNLITKGQKSINDIEITDKMMEAIASLLDDEPIDYVLSPECPKAFGLFPVPGSCRKYVHCRTGIAYAAECAPNTVFEASVETCVHPDQSSRSECSAPEIHQFLCPKYSSALATLRFGDHDRLAHPTDCSKFYACLLNGQPRVGSCPAPTVFDVTSGFCTNYKKVEGCENFYDHLRFKDVDYVARPIVSDAPARKMAFVEEAPVRSALTGSTKNFFNFEQKN